MTTDERTERFAAAARQVGAEVTRVTGADQVAAYIGERVSGTILIPPFLGGVRLELMERLQAAGGTVEEPDRRTAAGAAAGVTGANFALADTGTVVIESTAEAVRLATTLPERHFVLLCPEKILPDGLAAVPLLRRFNERIPRNYLAYITGPSRTADIERVLTIGVHGPRELHILLVEGLSEDPLEM